MNQTVLWWGKFDPEYSRNRIMMKAFVSLGWLIETFVPGNTKLAYVEARVRRVSAPQLIFVPCFCQKDIDTALRFGRHHKIPVLIDPLISLYDSRVFERKTVEEGSKEARKLLERESRSFTGADAVIADTAAHGRYFSEVLGVRPENIQVVPVSAEEELFSSSLVLRSKQEPIQVFFYGSFIPLQGVEVIVDAIRCYQGPAVSWVLLGGDGTALKADCIKGLAENDSVSFENNIPYRQLPERIQQADILLGVFGNTEKTVRVIPNKVYQALASGKPVITCSGPYPTGVQQGEKSGLFFVTPGDANALAREVARLALDASKLDSYGRHARRSYEQYFDNAHVIRALKLVLIKLFGKE